jgi:aminopeptidase N
MGEKGRLDLDFWALRYNEARARKQFAMVKDMLHCFEYWMGPYPFYEDGYKLVEAPYLGMEHQSAVAYGNKYQMGYLGRDRSGTGIGMLFDFIIVHESGHEWFGNNVTARDIADMWIHEGITTYAESLYAEWLFGKEKGLEYDLGAWSHIRNDKPIIGDYGVNNEGSGDMYNKGAAIMHMIRMMTNDDEKFRQMLRGLGKEFYHQTVTTGQVEDYISLHTGLELKAFFNQYLRTTNIPHLEYEIKNNRFYYRFTNIVNGFSMPVKIFLGGKWYIYSPTAEWQSDTWPGGDVLVSQDYLLERA